MDQNPTASYLTLDSFHFQERKLFISYFPGSSVGKDFACSAGDLGSSPGSERSPGEENGYPLQCSCLENPMDRVRESFPRQVDKESRGPQGERGLEFSRRKKGQIFFFLLYIP